MGRCSMSVAVPAAWRACRTNIAIEFHAAVSNAYCAGAPDGPRSLAATAWAVRGRVP